MSTKKHLEQIIQEIMETEDPIDINSSLSNDVGMQSIDFVELSVAIEKKIGISIPFDILVNNPTIKLLDDYMTNKKEIK